MPSFRNHHYEEDSATFSAAHYRVRGWDGFAVSVLGWEMTPNEDTEWSGDMERTGAVLVVMVGDDMVRHVMPDDLLPLTENEFCHSCGQIGCGHNV